MAKVTSGSFNTTAYSGRYLTFSWTCTQSTSSNQSTISWSLKGAGGSSTTYYKAGNFKVVIAGETVYSSANRIDLRHQEVAKGTKVITHSANGTKSFSASAEAGIYSVAVNCTGSGTWDLKDIPRGATITSAPNFTDEDTPLIKYTNPAGAAVDTLELCITFDGDKDDIAYRDISKTGSSVTFELSDAQRKKLRAATTGSNSRKIGFYLHTVIDNNHFYSKVWKTFTVVNATPTLAPTVTDTGIYSTQVTKDPNVIISGWNSCAFTTGATVYKEATISSQGVKCGGKSASGATGKLYNVTSGDFVFNVTDNRGNTVTDTVKLEFVNYFKPTCNLSVTAATTEGVMPIKISGKWFAGALGETQNALNVQFRIKEGSAEYSDWQDIIAIFDGNEYSGEISLTGLNYRQSYTIEARTFDVVGTYDEKFIASTNPRTLKTTPVYDWGANQFCVNVPAHCYEGITYDIPVLDGDCNAMVVSGIYYMGNTSTNRPIEKNGWLEVFSYAGGSYCYQRFMSYTGYIYQRWCKAGVWGTWAQL